MCASLQFEQASLWATLESLYTIYTVSLHAFPYFLLTSYIPCLSSPLSPLAVGSSSDRAQCVHWTEGVLSKLSEAQTSQPYWPPHTGRPQSVWPTLVTSQLLYRCEMCVRPVSAADGKRSQLVSLWCALGRFTAACCKSCGNIKCSVTLAHSLKVPLLYTFFYLVLVSDKERCF